MSQNFLVCKLHYILKKINKTICRMNLKSTMQKRDKIYVYFPKSVIIEIVKVNARGIQIL